MIGVVGEVRVALMFFSLLRGPARGRRARNDGASPGGRTGARNDNASREVLLEAAATGAGGGLAPETTTPAGGLASGTTTPALGWGEGLASFFYEGGVSPCKSLASYHP